MNNLHAQEYKDLIWSALKKHNLQNKLYFLATDGAKVVSSAKEGLYGKLKKEINYLNHMHCMAHRASLGIKELSSLFEIVKEINNMVYHICSYMKTYKRINILKIK